MAIAKTRQEQEAAFKGALGRQFDNEESFFQGRKAPKRHDITCRVNTGGSCNCRLAFMQADDKTEGSSVFKQDGRKFDKSARAFCPDLPDEMILKGDK